MYDIQPRNWDWDWKLPCPFRSGNGRGRFFGGSTEGAGGVSREQMDEVGLGERAWRLLYIYILENAYKNPDFYLSRYIYYLASTAADHSFSDLVLSRAGVYTMFNEFRTGICTIFNELSQTRS